MLAECPQCDFANQVGDRYCGNCGAALLDAEKIACPDCGNTVRAGLAFCPQCGAKLPDARPEELDTSNREVSPGERKPVTIFFADIVGSTEKAAALDPEEWREVVSGAHKRVGEAVGNYEGTVAQLLGDGVLAFFGAPVTHEDDPERAVRAALDLQESIREYADELAGYVDDFAMRVGIHAGTVVVGEMGSDEKSEYLAVGDAVNIAARLEGAAEPGQIVISEQIASRVRPAFELEPLDRLELKGVSKAPNAYLVQGEKERPERGRGLAPLEGVFVGRERELAELKESLLDLCRGHGQIRFILGEAGIGKSRLVEELRSSPPEGPAGEKLLAQPGELRWIEARALSYGSSLSFWLISQLLLSDLGLSDGAPAPQVRAALRKRSEALFGDRADEFEPFLSRLLGLRLKAGRENRLQDYDSETLRHETFRAVKAYFSALAQQLPVVLVLEDLHWADPSSLEALEQLLEVADQAPLMILGLMRIDDQHGSWDLKLEAETAYRYRFEDLYLNALQADESHELLARVLGEGSRGGQVAELVLARAEGNPFYLEELLRHLLERNLIVKENGRWVTTAELERVGVPDTLQGVLLARIDRLERQVQHTLQLASVIGRSFLYRLLAVISEVEEELQGHLSRLQRADLVREKARLPELEYMFKHAMTQEAAYNALLVEQRQRYHQRVAEAVEAQFSDRLEDYYGLLAHHYSAAGDADKAIDYLVRAADQARLEDSLAEAKQLLRQLLDHLDGRGRTDLEARTWMKLALVHQTNFEFDEAHRAYETAFELSRAAEPIRITEMKREVPTRIDGARFRMPITHDTLRSLDLSNVNFSFSLDILRNVQVCIAEVDDELNVIPLAARSWRVSEDGRRYRFTLREDLRWSDGSRVTTHDFKNYWIWQLRHVQPDRESWLDVLQGAKAYRKGEHDDPDLVGIKVDSDYRLELLLVEPLAHFLYLLTLAAYPAPAHLLDAHGMEWWRPPHGLYSGPFCIVRADENELVLKRNPYYLGQATGNLNEVRVIGFARIADFVTAYEDGEVDLCWEDGLIDSKPDVAEEELHTTVPKLKLHYVMLNPLQAPLDSIEFRKALAFSVVRSPPDWKGIADIYPAVGGIVPPGMPGHSANLALSVDLKLARESLSIASKESQGSALKLRVAIPPGADVDSPFPSQIRPWKEQLGLEIEFVEYSFGMQEAIVDLAAHVMMTGWVADFPDPFTFLVENVIQGTANMGWSDPELDLLIEEVKTARDRKKRIEIFRKIDHYLVREKVLVIPLVYGGKQTYLVKPWVKGWRRDALDHTHLKDVTVTRPRA